MKNPAVGMMATRERKELKKRLSCMALCFPCAPSWQIKSVDEVAS
jgi:hypothetical protein